MALQNIKYSSEDFKELDREMAPVLDIPHIFVDHCLIPKDGRPYMLFQAHVARKYHPKDLCCPVCGSVSLIKNSHAGARLLHDVLRNNWRTDILLKVPRLKCKDCGATFNMPVDGIEENRQMTKRLHESLKTEVFIQPETILAERTGFSLATIGNILDEEIDAYDAMRAENPLPAPRVLGIDEKHFGDIKHGVLVDVETGRLLDLLPNNSEAAMKKSISQLAGWDTDIRVVTTDMNNSYIPWLGSFLPSATIVVDKFHVVKDVNERVTRTKKTLIKYREKIIRGLDDNEEKNRQKYILGIVKRNNRLFNYNLSHIEREELEDTKLKLATVIEAFPEFKLLHNIRYGIEYLYTCRSLFEAEEVWADWQDLLPPAGETEYELWCNYFDVSPECFDEFRSFKRKGFLFFEPYILNYFRPNCHHTNAAAEGVNSLIETINTGGKGYNFKRLRGKCLYCSLVRERVNYGIDVDQLNSWEMDPIHMAGASSSIFGGLFSSVYNYGRSNKKRKTRYSYVEFTDDFYMPEVNIFEDTSWLSRILSADIYQESQKNLAALKEMSGESSYILCGGRKEGSSEMPFNLAVDEEQLLLDFDWKFRRPDPDMDEDDEEDEVDFFEYDYSEDFDPEEYNS